MPNTRRPRGRIALLAAIDYLVLSIIATVVLIVRSDLSLSHVPISETLLFLLSSLAAVVVFNELGLYRRTIFAARANQIVALGKGMLWVGIAQAVVVFMIKDPGILDYSRVNILLYVFAGWAGLTFLRLMVLAPLVVRHNLLPAARRRVAIVGAGHAGQSAAVRIAERPETGLDVVCFLDDDPNKQNRRLLGYRVDGGIEQVEDVVRRRGIDEIFVAINTVGYGRLLDIIETCRRTMLPVTVTASHFRIVHNRVAPGAVDLADAVTIRPTGLSPLGAVAKRGIDMAGAALLLLLMAPLFIAVSLWIKLDSRGPVFYRANVVGRRGRTFTWYKFRTMRNDRTEDLHREHVAKIIRENGGTKKLGRDPRITRSGRFLRRYSLDELPQLFNVLRGEMSLIGPRPCLPYEYEQFDEWHRRRFAVTPGLTGLWQVVGRDRSDVTFNDAVMLDLYYIENQSIWFDLKIILRTIPVVLFGRGGA